MGASGRCLRRVCAAMSQHRRRTTAKMMKEDTGMMKNIIAMLHARMRAIFTA